MSIFARQLESNCANCEKKRHIGTSIRALLPVPNEIINDVILALSSSQSAVSTALVDELKSRLSAKILDLYKNEVAMTHKTVGEDTLEAVVTPSITLASSYVAHKKKNEVGPVFWDEWTHHGDIFQTPETGGWKAVAWRDQVGFILAQWFHCWTYLCFSFSKLLFKYKKQNKSCIMDANSFVVEISVPQVSTDGIYNLTRGVSDHWSGGPDNDGIFQRLITSHILTT